MTQPSSDLTRILLVAGDATLLEILSQAIESQLSDITVITCPSIDTVLRHLEQSEFDVIVSDFRLGDGTAAQLLPAVQAKYPEIPVLLTSDYSTYTLAKRALREHGAYDLISRPMNWNDFINSLSSAIQHRQLKRLKTQLVDQHGEVATADLLTELKVLIVDDDRDSREMQSAALQSCGAEVLAVSTVRGALEVFDEFSPDVLVSDIRIPLEDGYSLIRKLRQRDVGIGDEIPALAVTAYAREEERRFALRAGYQLHLAKPVEPATLALSVASLGKRVELQPDAVMTEKA